MTRSSPSSKGRTATCWPGNCAAARGPGPGQVVIHLAPGGAHLLRHQAGQFARFPGRRIGEDGERRFQGMGQVARLSPGPFQYRRIMGQHVVEFLHQGLDFSGINPLQLRRLARPHPGQAVAQPLQRPQRQLELPYHRRHQTQGQERQGQRQDTGKIPHRPLQHLFIHRHHQPQGARRRRARPSGRQDHPHQDQQRHAARPQLTVLRLRARRQRGPRRQAEGAIPERAGAQQHLAVRPVHLPVEAGIRLFQARVAQFPAHLGLAIGVEFEVAGELVQVHPQFGPGLTRHMVLKQVGQDQPGCHQGGQHPGQRAQQQAPAQGARTKGTDHGGPTRR